MDQLIQYLDHNYAVLCPSCGKKVMDPDKKKGQLHLKEKCPSCGEHPKENKKSKRQRKKERQAAKEKERSRNCRAKY